MIVATMLGIIFASLRLEILIVLVLVGALWGAIVFPVIASFYWGTREQPRALLGGRGGGGGAPVLPDPLRAGPAHRLHWLPVRSHRPGRRRRGHLPDGVRLPRPPRDLCRRRRHQPRPVDDRIRGLRDYIPLISALVAYGAMGDLVLQFVALLRDIRAAKKKGKDLL